MVSINIFLFGKPEWEFGGKISAKGLRDKGAELKSRLGQIASALEKLSNSGWESESTLYDIIFYKDIPKATAKKELKELGINKELYWLMDDCEE